MKDSKIIATVGPTSFSESIIRKMDIAGVDIFRINMSHTNINDLESIIKGLKSWTSKEICIDTEGAQIRTGDFNGKTIKVKAHTLIELAPVGGSAQAGKIPISLEKPSEVLIPGDLLRIDFNAVVIQVVSTENKKVLCRVLGEGVVGPNISVSLDRKIKLPGFTKKDIKAFETAKKFDIRTFALSFASSADDIKTLRMFLPEDITIISKIENIVGLSNLESICKESEAILIDRGDLSRDVAIEKIIFAQNYILKVAKKMQTPVYIATNLLESMRNNFKPTRAEINDIVSILYGGAEGLVLAAETAIGKYPIACVRMIKRLIDEVKDNQQHINNLNYLCSPPMNRIIEPHGGELIQNYLWNFDRSKLKELFCIEVDDEILSDIVQIAEGTYSPLKGFMSAAELNSVLNQYRLPNGIAWPLPILFQVSKEEFKKIPDKGSVRIESRLDGKCYAIMEITERNRLHSLNKIAQKWFGTDDKRHPGVERFLKKGEYIISGEIFIIEKPVTSKKCYELSPRQTRNIFNDFGWQTIVGFHTRNIIHKGHEFIQKEALKKTFADAIFISPVVGTKKQGDFTAKVILDCYNALIRNGYYKPYGVLLGTFNTYSRYSGPREAVFTAICRKNFGCSHFIVGRDHAGVGNFYSHYDAQKLFEKVDISMGILAFDTAYFCSKCNVVETKCEHSQDAYNVLSGTKVRDSLLNGGNIPDYLMSPVVAAKLEKLYLAYPKTVFER